MSDAIYTVGRIATLLLVVSLAATGSAVAAPTDAPPTTQDETGISESEVICAPTGPCTIVFTDTGVDTDTFAVDTETGVTYFDSTGQQTSAAVVRGSADALGLSADAEVCYLTTDDDFACLG